MRPLGKAVVRTGLVSKDALLELRRWGLPVEIAEEEVPPIEDLETVVTVIREALDGSEQVRIQESDIDILRRFLDPKYQRRGTLTVKDGKARTSFEVSFCLTPMGEFVVPWKSEAIRDMVLMGESFIRFEDRGEEKKVHFLDARDYYFGNQRAFMVCTPESMVHNASR